MSSDAFYSRMAKTAGRLIDRFGMPITVTRTVGGSINPITGVVTPGQTQTFTPMGVFQRVPEDLVDGSRILASDRLLLLDDTVAVQMTDRISVGAQQWPIEEITIVQPAAIPVVYVVRVRK